MFLAVLHIEISLPDAFRILSISFSDRPKSVKIFLASSTTEAAMSGYGVDVEIFAVFSVVVFVYVPIFSQVGIPVFVDTSLQFWKGVSTFL